MVYKGVKVEGLSRQGDNSMPRKATMYLDTSSLNALIQEPAERRETTSRFFSQVLPNYEAFISELVLAEIGAAPDSELRDRLVKLVRPFQVLSVSSNAEALSREYLKYLSIPEADALHLAVASVEGINYFVTWNMRHIARERTRRIVDNINFLLGYSRIYIVTPDDFFD
ncbi:MAG: PIN domain-containing protein [Candidatus Jordarchaeaceae archaeon]